MTVKKLIFISLLVFSISGHADTIPMLSVYYNKVKVKELDLRKGNDFTVSSKNYKPGDYLAIQYFDDTKCPGCIYEISVVAEGKMEMMSKKFKTKSQLIKIELEELFSHSNGLKNKDPLFVVYLYTIDKNGKKDSGPRLMTLHIQ